MLVRQLTHCRSTMWTKYIQSLLCCLKLDNLLTIIGLEAVYDGVCFSLIATTHYFVT